MILDADPGVDDALAMMLALGSPELAVLGICTVSGNVPLDIGTGNALKVLALLDRDDVPVYPARGPTPEERSRIRNRGARAPRLGGCRVAAARPFAVG